MKFNFIQSKAVFTILTLILILSSGLSHAQTNLPRPDHVIICVLENKDYFQVIGSPDAPYINSLIPQSALMGEYYGLIHPSQPNYLMLFSGDAQNVWDNNLPPGIPWSTPNIATSMINAGFSFRGYSEDLPYVGATIENSAGYARKHNPWVNWQGTDPVNNIPMGYNLTMNEWPYSDLSILPTLGFVVPSQDNDMHNGSIQQGDDWVFNHMKSYIDWTYANNSLFILLFDEDNITPINHVPCLILGPMVQPGLYNWNGYNHYDMLRTIEEMYGLPLIGMSATSKVITEIWKNTTGVNDVKSKVDASLSFYPNPLTEISTITISGEIEKLNSDCVLEFYDVTGRITRHERIPLSSGQKSFSFHREGLAGGVYSYRLMNEKEVIATGKVVVD